jgi:hypothetical protein
MPADDLKGLITWLKANHGPSSRRRISKENESFVIAHPAEFGGIGAWRDFIFG